MECGKCRNARKNSKNGVYCLLFGIMIHALHSGCRYYKTEDEGNATEEIRNSLDGAATDPAE